ncbi:MAG: DUF5132 domain-containing protein [Prochloraceae cyanobacterium]
MQLDIEDLVEDFGLPGLAIGLGALVLTPVLAKFGQPIAKAAIKSSIAVYEKTKSAIAETGEVLEDIVAESQAELAEEQARKIQS